MSKRKTKQLPDKLSDLLDLAVTDSEECSRMKSYRLNMELWHQPNGKCSVCMAGSVMARTLGAGRRTYAEPRSFGDENAPKLLAINDLRNGYVANAYFRLHSELPPTDSRLDVASSLIFDNVSERTGRAPWRIYRKAARILREGGL